MIGGGVVGLSCALNARGIGRKRVRHRARVAARTRHEHAQQRRDSRRHLLSAWFAQGQALPRRAASGCTTSASGIPSRISAAGSCSSPRHESEIAELEVLRARGIANGATSLEMVDADFVRRKEPHVHAAAAVWSPDTGIVEAEALITALGAALPRPRRGDARRHRRRGRAPHRTAASSSSRHTSAFVAHTVVNAAGLARRRRLRDARRQDGSTSSRAAASTPSWRRRSAAG